MKRTLKTLLIICCMALCLTFCLTACGDECEHTYDNACDAACNECGEERTVAHTWQNADCDTPKTCTVCKTTEGKALGREWTTPDVDMCQVQSTCGRCGATDGENVEHTWVNATCTAPKTCSVCSATEGSALGHNYGTVTYTWSADNATCTATRLCANDSTHVETETVTASVDTTPASCTAEGNKKYTATFENTAFETQTKNISLPETNHECTNLKTENGEHWYECICGDKQLPKQECSGGTATCTDRAVCAICNTAYGAVDPINHKDENNDHICDRECGKTDVGTHGDSDLDHVCDYGCNVAIGTHADSNTDADHVCDYGCGEPLNDCDNLVSVEAIVANCTTAGNVAHYKCNTCGKTYADAAGAQELVDVSVSIDPIAHAYGEASYTWSNDYNTCTAERSCSHNAEHVEREEQNSTYANGTATVSFTNTAFSAQTVGLTDSTQMTADRLKAAVAYMLSKGETNIEITMAGNAGEGMFNAIRRALIDTEGVRDGSINLTLKGVTTIPDQNEYSGPSNAIFGPAILDWETNEQEVVKELASVNLPDVTYIGEWAFSNCSLTSLTAPKVQEVGQYAFYYSKLTSVELPEAITIGSYAFEACYDLTSVKLPKATSIGEWVFWADTKITSLELTAEGEITIGTNALRNDDLGKCDLVLNEDKKIAVEGTTWNGYTFANVTYPCTDGSTDHAYEAVSNDNGTHTLTCTICNQTKVNDCHGGEVTCQKLAVCEACGEEYGELSGHITDRATGYCTFGCGEFCAVAKITLGETTTYYNTLNEFLRNKQNGATITLLKDIDDTAEGTEYIEWSSCALTLDLNGFNFNRGGYELYWCGTGANVSLVNTAEKRAGITSAFAWGSGNKLTVGSSVDIGAILIGSNATDAVIDISEADFESTTIKVSGDGFNVSQIVVGGYAVYDADGTMVVGELTNGVEYTIRSGAPDAQNP